MTEPKHILVIDHDSDVAAVVAETLQTLGYRVSLAKDGEAMQAFVANGEDPDVIVLDASTSETPGLNVALQARELGIRLVMISGHPNFITEFSDRADQLLWKPFRREQLARAIEHALESSVFGQRKADPK
jgi:two-component system OmpR family response regulator